MNKLSLQSTLTLNNGVKIPRLGFGTYQITPGEETQECVEYALKCGYRHVDTAAYYENEASVGKAVRNSGIKREDIFVTTKLKNDDHVDPLKAFNVSFDKLNLDYIDLYLIHWPVPGKRVNTWKILEEIYDSGHVKAIGVSNFTVKHLDELIAQTNVIPAVNQVEFSPYLFQKDLLDYCVEKEIQIEAYCPLTRAQKLSDPVLVEVAKRYGKSTAQVLIRWSLQHDLVVLPKSSRFEKIKENSNVFDFELSKEDMLLLDLMNEDFHTTWDPSSIV